MHIGGSKPPPYRDHYRFKQFSTPPPIVLSFRTMLSAAELGAGVRPCSMVEQSDACECHSHAVLVAGHDNMVVTDRSTRLCDVHNA